MGDCLKAKNALNIVILTVEFSLDNNELKFAGLSGNQLGEIQISEGLDRVIPSMFHYSKNPHLRTC